MPRTMSSLALAAAILALVTHAPEVQAQATNAAKTACMEAVNRYYGGRVRDLRVVDSEFSQANSRVFIEANGERWRCLASNDGKVEKLRVQE
jgi:uncharacterized protein with LGFP repeats